ncbi:WecB/TagA/CpsF family glycosyltransferase [Shimia sp. SDUM112013]|uniref:WecB/TagA/CpsF family glycosyltransferase n=1 Tax=Shimia sp. SDUM112013 TaxID=3136160 RepID=UPI0032EB5824
MDFPSVAGRIAVNVPDEATLLLKVAEKLEKREGFALATINLDHLVKLKDDADFARAYLLQDLVVADGNPVVWMSQLADQPLELLPGSDLVLPLAKVAARLGVPVGLIGTTDDALERAAEAMKAEVPMLDIACCIAPPMGFDPDSAAANTVLREAENAGAKLCFLALGAPKQEILAARGRTVTPDVGFVSIGAGLDFLAGSQKRAPAWVRAMAMEWFWRMLQNPKRLSARYARCFVILPGLTADAIKQRKQPR